LTKNYINESKGSEESEVNPRRGNTDCKTMGRRDKSLSAFIGKYWSAFSLRFTEHDTSERRKYKRVKEGTERERRKK